MRANRARDTSPELRLRKRLHAAGLRYRVAAPVRVGPGRPLRPDIVFGPARVAVFVDGCFWHGCPEHASWPRRNAAFWRTKIEGNRARDSLQTQQLRAAGWEVVRVWEHEPPDEAAARIVSLVRARRTAANGRSRSVRGRR